ncbi:hypothetical protein [Zavarzinia sp.]|uniref:hypothetical protein n=1 Tax=Zavarzinia sp. TaxID=2027920 RepID=UPI003BB70576
MAIFNGTAGDDVLTGTNDADQFNGGAGNDTITGLRGDDAATVDVSMDGADSVDLGLGNDVVNVTSAGTGEIRVTFTSAEVGNGNALDAGTLANQDGGLAVRFQLEDAMGMPTGELSRYDDESITFVSQTPGLTFDVRDIVSGVQRGNLFEVVGLGTFRNDRLIDQGDRANYFNAGRGDDWATGGNGDDFLVGGAGDDMLRGRGGDDRFIGGAGNDAVFGSVGDDIAIFNVSTDGSDMVDLGTGADLVNVAASGPGQIRLGFTSSQVGNGDVNDSNTMANQDGGLAVRLQAENGMDLPTGVVSRFDDEGVTFVATTAGVTFDIRDLVSGVARGDQFGAATLGTSDGDTLIAALAGKAYYFNAGQGDDDVTGGDLADFLVGGAGNDMLDGGLGADSFIGGGGADMIRGGAGGDTAIFNVSTDGADSVDLGDGDDRVNVSASAPGQIRLSFTSAQVGNGNANDSNTLANQDGGLAVRLQAEDGADGLTGAISRFDDEGITFVATTAGVTFDVRDLVSGVARGDMFEAAILGTSGRDAAGTVVAGDHYFNLGLGNDTAMGGAGDDFLVGGGGNDYLFGGDGADSFIGGADRDQIFGGAGADRAIFNVSTDGADRIDLGGDMDMVTVNAAAPGQVRLTFTSSQVGNGNVNDSNTMANQDGGLAVRLQAENGADMLTGAVSRVDDEGITFVGGTGVTFDVRDLVSGAARGDMFGAVALGTEQRDIMSADIAGKAYYFNAGAGNDMVTGGIEADFLVGGAGNDILRGGRGDDSFIGGGGADRLSGSIGDDRFIYAATSDSGTTATTRDLITDFRSGDLIVLTAIDANSGTMENDAFSFIGTDGFTGVAGQLRQSADGMDTVVEGDVNGDGMADFQIGIAGNPVLTSADFLL